MSGVEFASMSRDEMMKRASPDLALVELEDGQLIHHLRVGDLEALGVLYDRHGTVVLRTALAITQDRCAAQDIVQDVFLQLLKSIVIVDPSRPLRPWLYRVTINLCYSFHRRRTWSLISVDQVVNVLISPRLSPENEALERESQEAVTAAMKELPWEQRVVVVLFYLNEIPVHEIAELLDCPEGTVKSRLYYSRRKLRKILQGEEQLRLDIAYGIR